MSWILPCRDDLHSWRGHHYLMLCDCCLLPDPRFRFIHQLDVPAEETLLSAGVPLGPACSCLGLQKGRSLTSWFWLAATPSLSGSAPV